MRRRLRAADAQRHQRASVSLGCSAEQHQASPRSRETSGEIREPIAIEQTPESGPWTSEHPRHIARQAIERDDGLGATRRR
ncbi:hypothetical protein SPRG_20141 [Saprolegnia parasitica CBS 223.65]|uniref:Uncharacterized protein n=1 Tax=Saprolegnia parasitica (strain CBS 223.65) TaxID=695850 RepID=A0A067CCS9_SAPPC|nr:hypothetical protein SPRG_20141 [Saprolegnia parasitica CBS 223.65]KDO28569.1 hypothetical protein SPRG_20141 [Saprolegnia parasitica CBS 223.65]|eukprot:XP_012200766.1 hypothetical protein SPRG_20141 [Saprolegnia parasitica CBS 223.65]